MSKCATLAFTSPEHTAGFARALAARLQPGDVLLFHGSIGAGKTHFIRSALQSILREPEDVPSPTYTLVQTYETRAGTAWHSDLYRLGHPDESIELGLDQAFEDALCFVEWPDRLGDLAPKNGLTITLETTTDDQHRLARFSWTDDKWNERLKGLLDD